MLPASCGPGLLGPFPFIEGPQHGTFTGRTAQDFFIIKPVDSGTDLAWASNNGEQVHGGMRLGADGQGIHLLPTLGYGKGLSVKPEADLLDP